MFYDVLCQIKHGSLYRSISYGVMAAFYGEGGRETPKQVKTLLEYFSPKGIIKHSNIVHNLLNTLSNYVLYTIKHHKIYTITY